MFSRGYKELTDCRFVYVFVRPEPMDAADILGN